MGHKHSVRDTNAHFTIDQYTRQIKNDSAEKTTIVQYDHNSQRLTFEMPLYIDSHAMTLCDLIEIHYINISTDGKSQNPGMYEVDDIKAEGNNAVFTWLISQECTQLAGSLNFFIVFKCTENGVTVYRWGTEIYTKQAISTGMDNGEAVLTEYPDILAQWKAQLFDASNTAVTNVATAETKALAAIEAAGEAKKQSVLDSIPDEYEALSALADSNYRNKAGAIVVEEEGESIVLNDASEYPLQNLKVFGKSEQIKTTGKNLFDITKEELIVVGSSGVQRYGYLFDITGTYTFSCLGNNETSITCKIVSDGVYGDYKSFVLTANYTVTLGEKDILLIYRAEENVRLSDGIANAQLESGSVATEYEPYSGGVASPSPEWAQEINSMDNAVVSVLGKNLAYFGHILPKTAHGVTFSLREDGSIIAHGTPTVSGDEVIDTIHAQYITRPTLVNGQVYESDSTIQIEHNDGSMTYNRIVTITEDVKAINAYIQPRAAYYTNGQVFNVKLWLVGNEMDEFEAAKPVQTITIPRTLPGIPVASGGNYTDENGQEWICDEVDLARGVYVQCTKLIELKNINTWRTWGVNYITEGNTGFYAYDDSLGTVSEMVLCTFLRYNLYAYGGMTVGVKTASSGEQYFTVAVKNDILADTSTSENAIASFKSWLQTRNEKLLVTIKPVEIALSDAEITAFKALHSNKPNTTILNDAGAYMAVEYVADTKTYIDNKIAEMMEVE